MNLNESFGQFTGPAEIRLVRRLPGPIERVWDYLTDPEKRARWFAGGVIEPRVGGKVELIFKHKNLAPEETPPEQYKDAHETGRVMESVVTRWEPPRVLAFIFGSDGDSEAIFELTPEGNQVLLVLTHRSRGGDLPYMASFGAGWHTHFMHLIAQLEGAPKPAFWSHHAHYFKEYEKLRIEAQKT